MLSHYPKRSKELQKGFTLIELSIVLVIIGLIVGGILVGQDLIKAAEVRATISQIEKYNTAVNTFRTKYNGIPGDLQQSTAASFGLYSLTGAASPCATVGGTGCGDGNGLVEGAAAGATALIGEVPLFFRQLSDAGIMDGSFAGTGAVSGTITSAGALGAATSGTGITLLLPQAKLARGNYIIPESASGVNYFVMTGMTGASIVAATGVVSAETNNLTSQESFNIDKKVDDGLPGSGAVFAIDGTGLISTPATLTTVSAIANCVTSSAYLLTATTQACSLRMRFN